jgi:UDP-N-acetylglucosamine 2-epimerase (non-hydrolysing)
MKILNVVGTRPNFVKIAPIIEQIGKSSQLTCALVHTGQHYDKNMNQTFFDQLSIPNPDINLDIKGGSNVQQVSQVMEKFETVIERENPQAVLVVGDVNSTLACSMVSAYHGIKVIHIEAGLRSFDLSMPEEINRMLTDKISDLLFITEESAKENLEREGIDPKKIKFVGNVMADTLLKHKEMASNSSNILVDLKLKPQQYSFLTLHRPSNVDSKEVLEGIMQAIRKLSKEIAVVFPIHPRTKNNIYKFKLAHLLEGLILTPPIPYWDMVCLMENSRLALTDSGGIQEETTILNIPCLTLRNNTERPITIVKGTNTLAGNQPEKIFSIAKKIIESKNRTVSRPNYWDGFAAQRIVNVLEKWNLQKSF